MRLRPAQYDLKTTFEILEEDPNIGFFVGHDIVFLPETPPEMSINKYPQLETIGIPFRRYVKGSWYYGPTWTSWPRLCLRNSEDSEATAEYAAQLLGPPSFSRKSGLYMGERSLRYDFLIGQVPEPQRDPAPHIVHFHFPDYYPSGEMERVEFSDLGMMKDWIFYPAGCHRHWSNLPKVQAAARERLAAANGKKYS